jgi:hypothetical protein
MLKKLLVFIFIFVAQSLFAYNCKIYANRAKKHALAASALNCGFTGDRWQIEYQPHFKWCKSSRVRIARKEDTTRTDMLKKCAVAPIWVTKCNIYVKRAIGQFGANQHLVCNLTGERWHNNLGAHQNWCNTATVQAMNLEDAARRGDLGRCIGKGGGYYYPADSDYLEQEELEDYE